MQTEWFESSFRRALVDMHIPDWDPSFLSEFDSDEYIRLMALAHVDAVYIYATSCVGLANYPARAGNVHAGLAGTDVVREVTQAARRQGMKAVVYYNFWSKWAYDNHPDWRVVDARGRGTADYMWGQIGRYGVCCLNSPYRDFVLGQVRELCSAYDFDGFWVDMVLLPQTICYCENCRLRHERETGLTELPRIIDWSDPEFVAFQRRREAWLTEFTQSITDTVTDEAPGASIGYNVSSYSVGWTSAPSAAFFAQNSYLSGDVSSDALTVSYTCKLFHSSSPRHAMEFMTSLADSNLLEHTIMKTRDHLRTQLFLTVAHQSAFGFIDAIDPAGTLHEARYVMMGELYDELIPLEPYLDASATFRQDVAVYTNFSSLIDPAENGTALSEGDLATSPHFTASMNAARSLRDAHIPFGVINEASVARLDDYQIVVLPDLIVMSAQEVAAFTRFVENGGRLYASFRTSLLDDEGTSHEDFMLSDVFGVSYTGCTDTGVTYIAPTNEDLLPGYSARRPLSMQSEQAIVSPHVSARVDATIVVPRTHPTDVDRFSSAISSPPEVATEHPAMVRHTYGGGESIYVAGPLESMEKSDQRAAFIDAIRSLRTKPWAFTASAPACVELTLFHQERHHRFVMHAVNVQQDTPNIPIHGVRARVFTEGIEPATVSVMPSGQALAFTYDGEYVEFEMPVLDTYLMIVLSYGP